MRENPEFDYDNSSEEIDKDQVRMILIEVL